MVTYFEDKKNKSKKKLKKYKTLTTLLKSFDTFVIIARTSRSSSATLSLTGIGLIAIPISTATTYGLSVGYIVIDEINMQKYNKYKKTI